MRLDAVYLVAPKPKPPSVPTRRAFLVAGATFCAGLGLGGACGYAVGAGKGGGPEAESAEPEVVSSGDALLDELRRLATKAPIEELMAKYSDFCDRLYADYPTDSVAWSGVGRIAQALLNGYSIPDRQFAGKWVAQFIQRADASVRSPLEHFIPELRKLR